MSELNEDIICPYCKQKQSSDTLYANVTYWGSDETKKIQCEECEEWFYLNELVERNFETIKIEEKKEATPRT